MNLAGGKCTGCGRTPGEHEKEKVFHDDGPASSWSHNYICPGDARSNSIRQ